MVTIYYKGVIIISRRVKAVSVILAVIFAFAGAIYAFADEPNAYSLNTTSAAVSPTSIKTAPLLEAFFDTNEIKLTAKKITDSSVVLNWSGSNSVAGYKVCKYNVLTDSWEEVAATNENSIKIKNLKADTEYRFCITNGASNELLCATLVKTAIKRPELKLKERTSNSIALSVKNKPEDETVVIYRKTAGKSYKKIAELTDDKSFTDSNLKGDTAYFYRAKTLSESETDIEESDYSSTLKVKTGQLMGLPAISGSTKTYAYYTAVTAKSSPQYKLLNSSKCTTDEKTGIRMYEGCYCVALGSFYGSKIGTKYRITFSNGNSINVVLCDQKANRHTDSNNQYAMRNRDIVEFYVQKSMIPSGIRGDYGRLSQFSGSVVSIVRFND